MKPLPVVAAVVVAWFFTGAAWSDQPDLSVEDRAAAMVRSLTLACPVADYGDEASFQACFQALRSITLPFGPSIAWGGDQPDKPINKKTLTHFNSQVFQTLYLPLFTFTGHWTLDEDKLSHTPIIRVEAFFRNTLPPGNYPYPFWHSAAKWGDYEAANEIRFYLNPLGEAVIATRASTGSDARRGPYAEAMTPAFDGAWQWQGPKGEPQPRVDLFSARYDADNPYLAKLDEAYRVFALRMRDESCLECHTPANRAKADRLVLLQTPLHAAGEIDNVIKAIESGEMPQDDIGLRKDIPAEKRAMILHAAIEFRDELAQADTWQQARVR